MVIRDSTVNNNVVSKQNSTQNIFNIRPAAVKKWIEELPLGSTGESSKQLYIALKKVNQQNNTVVHHLAFLESISPTLELLYPRLSKYFTNISLPIDTKTNNVIHITTALITEILRGYQTIIKTLNSKKPFGWKKSYSLALHRSLIYSSQILCTQRLAYKPHSKGIWCEIFWYYQQAKKLKLLNKNHHNGSNNNKKTSIEYEFKRLLLLSLLSTNNLSQKNMREVHNLMPLWVKHSNILDKEAVEKKTCFTLNLSSDISPYIVGTRKDNTQDSADREYFSTYKLKVMLSDCLKKIEDDGVVQLGNNILSKLTIQSLLSNWSHNHLRTEVRKEGSGFVDVITGITAIHFVLNQQDQPAYDETSTELPENVINFESTLIIEPLNETTKNDTLSLDHFLSTSEQQEDVWGKVYENSINEAAPIKHWTETGTHKVFSFARSILLDYSKGGYRLSVYAKKIDSLKHNELIAIREHALAPWALGQVKWLHFSGRGDVQFGLRILTNHVLPVHVSYQTNNDYSKPLPCLLGLDRKKLMLFVPMLPTNLDGKKLQLEHQNKRSQINLKNKILTTPAFDVYEILELQNKDHLTTQNINKSETIINTNLESELSDNIWNSF